MTRSSARIGANNLGRAVAAGPRDAELDVAEFGQKMPPIIAIAAIGSVVGLELVEIAVDSRGHLVFDDLRHGSPAEGTIALGPIQAVRLHRLHDFKRHR
jgi:hypothetical protein